MDYQALYNSKLTTAAEAAKVVKSGDWVDYGWCTGTPVELDKALGRSCKRAGRRQHPRRRPDGTACHRTGSGRKQAFLLELLAHERH